jgi:multisubunit Na+/H+ antiporter MnhB subunit
VVTAILADWRGLDTMGEVTVLAIILVGIGSFLKLRSEQ